MKRIFLIPLLALTTILVAWIWSTRNATLTTTRANTVVRNDDSTNKKSASSNWKEPTTPPVPSFIADTNDARILALSVRDFYAQEKVDPQLEWKTPINFWGQVIDQSNNPIVNANVHFVWNDLSENGTSEADAASDKNGFFSLLNRHGKGLTVSVGKTGYYDTRNSFEYAQPEIRFSPDPGNPVVFLLRKKNGDASIISKTMEITINVGKTVSLPLDEQTILQIDLLTNTPMSAKQWAARINISNGGIQLALDQFPFEAPLEGYQSEINLDCNTPKPPTWGGTLYQGGQFYVKTVKGYGRIELRMISGKTFMQVSTFLNPTGSNNLETQ